MLPSDFNDLLPRLNIIHTYFDNLCLNELLGFKERFQSYTSDSVVNILQNNKKTCDILFIELSILNKQNVSKLNTLIKKYNQSDIYIFTKEPEKLFILKFALHFGIKKVLPLKNEQKFLKKTLFEACTKTNIKRDERQQVEVSRCVNSFFAFMVFNNKNLIFANDKAKKIFEADTLEALEQRVKSNEVIFGYLDANDERTQEIILENNQKERWKYTLFTNKIGKGKERLISIVPNRIMNSDEAFLTTLNRFKFIERLKDKLAQNATTKNSLILMMVNISNYQKLVNSCSNLKVHEFIKKFITQLSYHKETYQDLIQWNPSFFIILIENRGFQETKSQLESLHQKLIYQEIDKSISPIISSSILKIDQLDINNIIKKIDKINEHSFNSKDFEKEEFFELAHFNSDVDENEQIHNYLKTCVGNKTPLKLLNIYKGLCINTQSNIIKANADKSYVVHCENLQAYSMQFENRTVIQSTDLSRDINASIIHINVEKSQALINNLYFLEASANNREHTRVQPSFRTPINMKYKKHSYHGEMLDLSTQAIAMKFNHSLSSELYGKKIELNFKLPDQNSDLGYLPMYVTGKIVFVGELSLTKTKIVVMMDLHSPYDSYLLKYMYSRQKELIVELKKFNKLNTKKRMKVI